MLSYTKHYITPENSTLEIDDLLGDLIEDLESLIETENTEEIAAEEISENVVGEVAEIEENLGETEAEIEEKIVSEEEIAEFKSEKYDEVVDEEIAEIESEKSE